MCMTFVRCRTNVFDVGPTLYKCHTNVLCLMGSVSLTLQICRVKLNLHVLIIAAFKKMCVKGPGYTPDGGKLLYPLTAVRSFQTIGLCMCLLYFFQSDMRCPCLRILLLFYILMG